jgi:trehalose-6-phosphate synthase
MTLWIVSNRLPITIAKKDNSWNYEPSSGGLVTALSGLKIDFTWVGWPGLQVGPKDQELIRKELIKSKHVPVFLNSDISNNHYNGFSNSILWPLFHYHSDINFSQSEWEAYNIVNSNFAQVIVATIKTGDYIWIHDYHLMMLPKLLHKLFKEMDIKATIGFFLHIPFPSYESFFSLTLDVLL